MADHNIHNNLLFPLIIVYLYQAKFNHGNQSIACVPMCQFDRERGHVKYLYIYTLIGKLIK